jgi:DNA-binding HxlR family transcriptional regulator
MMRWTDVNASLCPVARTAAIIGDRWTVLILREAFLGATSFDQFETVLGVSPHILSVRLKRLVAEGIFTKQKGGYHLTEAGHDLQPVIMLIASWGRRWRPEPGGPSSEVLHKTCGHSFEPVVACSECGDPVGHADVRTRLSAALIAERQAAR